MRSANFTAVATALSAVALLAVSAGDAFAHGGFYQTPRTPDGVPIGPGGSGNPQLPGQGTPVGAPGGGPAVTGRKKDKDRGPETEPTREIPSPLAAPAIRGAKWEHWWQRNQLRFLGLAHKRLGQSQTPSGESDAPGSAAPDAARLGAQFVNWLADGSQDVRAAAAIALMRIRSRDAAPALRTQLADEKHPDVRAALVLALAMLRQERDLLLFHGLLSDEDEPLPVREFAALGVGMVGGPDAVAIVDSIIDYNKAKPSQVPPALIAMTYYGLGFSGDPAAAATLMRALEEKHHKPVVRSYAELALGRLGHRDALTLLSDNLLRDADVSMRRSAALAVGMLVEPGDEQAVARLRVSAANNGDPGTRRMSALALGTVRASGLRAALEDGFNAAKDLDRPFFGIALALQGDLESSTVLREALVGDEFEESLQAAHAIALGILGDRGAAPLLEREVGRAQRLWSPGYAALGLAMMGSRGSIPTLTKRYDSTTDPRLRNVLDVARALLRDPAAIASLRARVRDGSSIYDRATAALALGIARTSEAAPDLERTADDLAAPAVLRAASVSALGRIVAADTPPLLCRILDGDNFSIELGPMIGIADVLNQR